MALSVGITVLCLVGITSAPIWDHDIFIPPIPLRIGRTDVVPEVPC